MIDLEVSFVAVGRSDAGGLGDGAVAANRSTRAAAMERYAVKVHSKVGQTVHPPPQVDGAELLALGAALSRLRAAGAAERDVVGTGQKLFARLFAEQNRAIYHRAQTIAEHTDQPLMLLLALSERRRRCMRSRGSCSTTGATSSAAARERTSCVSWRGRRCGRRR